MLGNPHFFVVKKASLSNTQLLMDDLFNVECLSYSVWVYQEARNWILVISFSFNIIIHNYLPAHLLILLVSMFQLLGKVLIWPASPFRMWSLLRTCSHKICYKGISSVLRRFGPGKSSFYHLVLLSHFFWPVDFIQVNWPVFQCPNQNIWIVSGWVFQASSFLYLYFHYMSSMEPGQ